MRRLAKPGLDEWKIEQGIMAALTLPRLPDESLDSFAHRVVVDMGEQVEKAADFGSHSCRIRKFVDQGELAGIIEEGLLLMLAMDVEKQRRQLTQCRNGAGLVIDVDAIPFVGRDLAADNDVAAFRIQSKSIEVGADVGFKNGFDDGAAFAGADHLAESFRTGKQSERVNDDGFSCAGLAGQEIETFFEVKLELIDQSKISNAKKPQHTRAL